MKRILRFLVSIALLTGLRTGCAGVTAKSDTASAPENTSAKTEPSASDGSGDTEAAWPRTITDALGNEVTIESEPQRIVVIHFSDMEYMLALDAPLIGSGFAESRIASWDTLESYRGKGIEDIGSSAEPSLEKVLELEPDLIIANKDYNTEMYDEFVAGMSQESIWNSLKAVKNGHVIYLNISVWSGSPRAIELAAPNILAGVEQ